MLGKSGKSSHSIKVTGASNHFYQNWSKTYSASPEFYFEPENESVLKTVLDSARHAGAEVKIVGGCLSPSDIACTTGYMISLKRMNKILDVDSKKLTITVQAGVLISELNDHVLPKNGLAFTNLPSISDQSVGGIIATGTHGTGVKYGSFATCVLDLWLMKSSGEVIHCSLTENKEIFSASCCHLGLLGIVVAVKLQCEPAFNLVQRQFPCTFDYFVNNYHELFASSEYFRANWFPHSDSVVAKCAHRTQESPKSDSNWLIDMGLGYYLLEFMLWLSTFFSFLVPYINRSFFKICYSGKRQMIDRSDRVLNINCLFRQYVTEWAIPRRCTADVLTKMRRWLQENPDVKANFPVEIRVVKKDNIMLSPSGDEDVTYIGIVSYRPYGKFVSHNKWWKCFENLCKSVHGKPHWAKDHEEKEKFFRSVYKSYDTFMEIRKQLDPENMFINDYWRRILDDRDFLNS